MVLFATTCFSEAAALAGLTASLQAASHNKRMPMVNREIERMPDMGRRKTGFLQWVKYLLFFMNALCLSSESGE
jgi:hypothetical protein